MGVERQSVSTQRGRYHCCVHEWEGTNIFIQVGIDQYYVSECDDAHGVCVYMCGNRSIMCTWRIRSVVGIGGGTNQQSVHGWGDTIIMCILVMGTNSVHGWGKISRVYMGEDKLDLCTLLRGTLAMCSRMRTDRQCVYQCVGKEQVYVHMSGQISSVYMLKDRLVLCTGVRSRPVECTRVNADQHSTLVCDYRPIVSTYVSTGQQCVLNIGKEQQ